MDPIAGLSLWQLLEDISSGMESKHLADVFRFVSFQPGETYGPHGHLRMEVNYVKKGNCMLRLDDETVSFREGETMIITSGVNHLFEAGAEGVTLLQLEFLPDVFSHFNFKDEGGLDGLAPVTLFSEENRLIKIVNNVRIVQTVQRIVNELDQKRPYYRYLVLMSYAELLILVYRYLNEVYLPICANDALRKAIGYIRSHYHQTITIRELTGQVGIGERYLRKLFVRYLNLSPLDYLNQIRVNKSIELLRNTALSVKEISYQCGFRSPQYFSRIFKQQTGMSPRDLTR